MTTPNFVDEYHKYNGKGRYKQDILYYSTLLEVRTALVRALSGNEHSQVDFWDAPSIRFLHVAAREQKRVLWEDSLICTDTICAFSLGLLSKVKKIIIVFELTFKGSSHSSASISRIT